MKFIIVNDNAGRGYCKKILPRLLNFFDTCFERYKIEYTRGPDDAIYMAKSAVEEGYKEIVSVGGDGTALEILQEAVDKDMLLSIIPAGTGNDLAKSLGFSTEIDLFLSEYKTQLTNKKESLVDIAYSEQYGPFFSICGLGFITEALIYVNNTRDSFIKGRLSFANAVFQTLRNLKCTDLEIEVDGVSHKRSSVLVGVINSTFAGGGMKFVPEAKINDGYLHVFLVSDISGLELLKVFPKVYKGEHLNHRAVEVFKGKKVSITSKGDIPASFDGNVYGSTPLSIYIREQSQRVITGPKFEEGK
jgi:YegS/Rv2252/BmrU family lipid kinase